MCVAANMLLHGTGVEVLLVQYFSSALHCSALHVGHYSTPVLQDSSLYRRKQYLSTVLTLATVLQTSP
jgi:hypothetical protein